MAKEAGLCYAAVALATDYDSWNDKGDSVSVGDVLALFKQNIKKVLDILLLAIVKIYEGEWDQTIDSLKVKFAVTPFFLVYFFGRGFCQ